MTKLNDSGRERIEDKIFDSDLENFSFHNKHFLRVGGKTQSFKNINFSHSYFEHCYFRNIVFDTCNFNGCKFINCNFQGSKFPGSDFEYSTFDKTFIDSEILDNNCPSYNNLTLKFARTLRTNYQGLGESESVNKAIKIELNATNEYFYESWKSKSTYYRNKYKGFDRLNMFLKWINFKIQDLIWGNGESPTRLITTGLFLWVSNSILDTILFKNPFNLLDYFDSLIKGPSIFMGIYKPEKYSDIYLTTITVIRFIGFALFTSILIKRFNRR